jgi:hypothetical protein
MKSRVLARRGRSRALRYSPGNTARTIDDLNTMSMEEVERQQGGSGGDADGRT